MSKERNSNNNQTTNQPKFGKEERVLLAKIFFNKDKIYDEYAELTIEREQFKKDVVSHLKFLQELCRAGLKDGDVKRLNGVINFCESFLIRNHLIDIEENDKNKETIEPGGNNETIG